MSAKVSKIRARKHPALIVLQSLLDGIPVEIEGESYWLDEKKRLVVEREAIDLKTQKSREVFLLVDMSIGAFLNMCERLSDEDIITIAGNNLLNQARRGELRG